MTIGFPRPRSRSRSGSLPGSRVSRSCAWRSGLAGGVQRGGGDAGAGRCARGRRAAGPRRRRPTDRRPDRGEASVPLKPNGETCYVRRRLRVGLLRRRRLLQQRLRGRLLHLRGGRASSGPASPRDVGHEPEGLVHRRRRARAAATPVSATAPAPARSTPRAPICQESGCAGSTLTSAGRCDGMGACTGAHQHVVRAVPVRTRAGSAGRRA